MRVAKVGKEGMEVEGSVRGELWKSVKTWMCGRKKVWCSGKGWETVKTQMSVRKRKVWCSGMGWLSEIVERVVWVERVVG